MSTDNRKSLEDIHNYWINESSSDYYIDKMARSEFFIKFVQKYIATNEEILEIGCNVGRNLNYLLEHDYRNLTGIEISEEAINNLKKTHPKLAKQARIIHSPIEDIIKELPANHYDLVFTMAVLEHIHPESEWIFNNVANITKSYLITIEAEDTKHWRIFPRKYKDIFEKLGLKEVENTKVDKDTGLGAYTLRVFKKNN